MELKAFKVYIETEKGINVELIFAKSRRGLKLPDDVQGNGEILKVKDVTKEIKEDIRTLVKDREENELINIVLKTVGLL